MGLLAVRSGLHPPLALEPLPEVARAAEWGFKNGVLDQRPSVITLQCDEDHPTQSLSDLLHLTNYFGG
ncbi:MAG: knotted carbamoyltransferase YgeW, partial [candidate division NC10 bacterium]